jgi:hypothetical protein
MIENDAEMRSPWHLNEIRLTAEDRSDEPRRGR